MSFNSLTHIKTETGVSICFASKNLSSTSAIKSKFLLLIYSTTNSGISGPNHQEFKD